MSRKELSGLTHKTDGSVHRILEEFRSLRWMPLQPKLLDYENTQFLVIGSGVEDLSKATDQQAKDEKHHKDTPLEEMEKLEHEDEIRVEHLKGRFLGQDQM